MFSALRPALRGLCAFGRSLSSAIDGRNRRAIPNRTDEPFPDSLIEQRAPDRVGAGSAWSGQNREMALAKSAKQRLPTGLSKTRLPLLFGIDCAMHGEDG